MHGGSVKALSTLHCTKAPDWQGAEGKEGLKCCRALLPCTLVLGCFCPKQGAPYLCQAMYQWGYIHTGGTSV